MCRFDWFFSQDRLESTLAAYVQGQCNEVAVLANEALRTLPDRPEPRELRATCEMREGDGRAAITTLRAAIDRDPRNWRLHYSLAVAHAHEGRDPRLELRRALRLNPRNQQVRLAVAEFDEARGAEQRRSIARRLGLHILIPAI